MLPRRPGSSPPEPVNMLLYTTEGAVQERLVRDLDMGELCWGEEVNIITCPYKTGRGRSDPRRPHDHGRIGRQSETRCYTASCADGSGLQAEAGRQPAEAGTGKLAGSPLGSGRHQACDLLILA